MRISPTRMNSLRIFPPRMCLGHKDYDAGIVLGVQGPCCPVFPIWQYSSGVERRGFPKREQGLDDPPDGTPSTESRTAMPSMESKLHCGIHYSLRGGMALAIR